MELDIDYKELREENARLQDKVIAQENTIIDLRSSIETLRPVQRNILSADEQAVLEGGQTA